MCRIYCSPGPKNYKKKCCSFQTKLKKIQNGQLKTSILMIWAHFGPAAERKKTKRKKKTVFRYRSPKTPKTGPQEDPKKSPGLQQGRVFLLCDTKSAVWAAIVAGANQKTKKVIFWRRKIIFLAKMEKSILKKCVVLSKSPTP